MSCISVVIELSYVEVSLVSNNISDLSEMKQHVQRDASRARKLACSFFFYSCGTATMALLPETL